MSNSNTPFIVNGNFLATDRRPSPPTRSLDRRPSSPRRRRPTTRQRSPRLSRRRGSDAAAHAQRNATADQSAGHPDRTRLAGPPPTRRRPLRTPRAGPPRHRPRGRSRDRPPRRRPPFRRLIRPRRPPTLRARRRGHRRLAHAQSERSPSCSPTTMLTGSLRARPRPATSTSPTREPTRVPSTSPSTSPTRPPTRFPSTSTKPPPTQKRAAQVSDCVFNSFMPAITATAATTAGTATSSS